MLSSVSPSPPSSGAMAIPMLVDGTNSLPSIDQRLGHGVEDLAREPVDRVAVLADALEDDELVAAEPGDEMASRSLAQTLRRPRSATRRRRGGRACR